MSKSQLEAILLSTVLFLIVVVLVSWFLLNPKFSVRADGTTVSLKTASFYIPASEPQKVYIFNPQPSELEKIIQQNIANYPATFGVVVKNISTGQEVSVNANEQFTAASIYKLSVMYTIFNLADQKKLDINSPDIQENLKSMIEVSSNEAAWHLVDKYTSWAEVTQEMKDLGLKNTSLNQNPTVTTPADTARLIELIAQGKAVNLEASVSMLELMAAQKRNDRIPALLPDDVIVAHKTGELDDVRHDAGVLIGPENNIVLVLMSKDSADPEAVKPIMQKLSADIYDFFKTQWSKPPEIL